MSKLKLAPLGIAREGQRFFQRVERRIQHRLLAPGHVGSVVTRFRLPDSLPGPAVALRVRVDGQLSNTVRRRARPRRDAGTRHNLRMPIRVAVILVGVACAALRAQPQSEEKAVVAVVQRMFDAMASRDPAAAQSVLIAEGRYFSVRENGAQVAVGGAAHKEFAERLAGGKEEMRERMWNPKVLIHGRIAVVWTPYDFHRNRKFSHCGVDAFSLIKTSAGWKIAGFVYTVEPAGCPESPLGALPGTP